VFNNKDKKFGTFEGVFTPTILTIIGVILYLRLGWVIGNVGLLGAIIIILLAHIATITTGLSLASMTTNIRIRAGGFYSIITKSLGLEVGASIGIPLYISQTLGAALYIIGFTKIFIDLTSAYLPALDEKILVSIILFVLMIISYIGAKIAMKIQFFIMAIVLFSFVSFFGSDNAFHSISLEIQKSENSFWYVFAVFFPAVTGIGSGAAMSGDLRDPKKSMPLGILSAVGVGLVIYLGVAIWMALTIPEKELQENTLVMIAYSKWGWAITAGILGATLSSALGTLIAAPRILMALAQDRVLPFSKILARQNKKGEPQFALIFTVLLVELSLLLGDLNSIAEILTMFFLITYGAINLAVLIEKGIKIPSYRPSFSISIYIPLIGSIWCIAIMFLINPMVAMIAILSIIVLFYFQLRRDLTSPFGDVRSGLFNSLAELAVKTATRLPQSAKSWKPKIFLPIETPEMWYSLMPFLRDIMFPSGSLSVYYIRKTDKTLTNKISNLVESIFKKDISQKTISLESVKYDREKSDTLNIFQIILEKIKKDGILNSSSIVDADNFIEGISVISQVLKARYFPPNTIFLLMNSFSTTTNSQNEKVIKNKKNSKDKKLESLIAIAIREKLGILILSYHPHKQFGQQKQINLWIRQGGPNRNLAILIALQVANNWHGNIRILTVINDDSKLERDKVHKHILNILDRGRLPLNSEIKIFSGDFFQRLIEAPIADINIFGISGDLGSGTMIKIAENINATCLFVKDSGEESILA